MNGSLTLCYIYPTGGSKNRPKILARRDCVFCIFDERHVAVVGIELWMSPWVSCLVFG